MNRAFIFDMDGVLVDSEKAWKPYDTAVLKKFFDEKTRKHIGDTTGLGVVGVFARAREAGATIEFDMLADAYDEAAVEVYRVAPLTEGTDRLAAHLSKLGFKLGLVTSSPQNWVDRVIPRLSWRDRLEVTISIGERPDLKPKPAPDGFLEALRTLDADPNLSIVLEDSNYGIEAGKTAGCFVIGFRGNLPAGYLQTGADGYADTMDEVIEVLHEHVNM